MKASLGWLEVLVQYITIAVLILFLYDMDLRHLRYFIITAEELHFTRAAERIGIAQPPLTFQIKSLENELGVKLFDRTPGRVNLTAAGEVLLRDARSIMNQVEIATARCKLAAQGVTGRLAVGFTESASFTHEVPLILQRFRRQYPEVGILLEEHRSEALIKLLCQGLIDVAFVRLPIGREPNIKFKLISTEEMVLAVPKDHKFAKRRTVQLKDLKEEYFILYPRATRLGLSDQFIAACENEGFSPRVVQIAPQISSTINLVAGSLGITVVPASMRTSRADQVRYISISASKLEASLGVAWRDDCKTPALQNLLALIDQVM